MFTEKDDIFIKENMWRKFINNSSQFGFTQDRDGDYVLQKVLENNDNLYVQFSVSSLNLKVYIEFHIPRTYWLEVGLETFEPLWTLYKKGGIWKLLRKIPIT